MSLTPEKLKTTDAIVWLLARSFSFLRVEYAENNPTLYSVQRTSETRRPVADWMEANVVSSRYPDGRHGIAIDLDHPAKLLESSTPGHHHLYVDLAHPLTWRRYKRLLRALARAGVIEWGYYRASCARKATHLRRPGVTKSMPAGDLSTTY